MTEQLTFGLDAPLSGIVVLGGRAASETVARFAGKHGIAVSFFTGPRQKDLPAFDGGPLYKRLEELGHKVRFVDDIKKCGDGPYKRAEPGTIILGFSAPFPMDAELLELYGGRAINAHGTPLPRYRGGGGFSWPILVGDRKGAVTLHLVTNAWGDNGPLIVQEPFDFPADLRYPGDYETHMQQREGPVINDFLEGLHEGRTFELTPQDDNTSTFMPRLHTPSQAYIDWSWPGDSIERFVLAFSHPYPGAMTFGRNGQEVRMFDCRFDPALTLPHPFINGVVFRKTEGRCFIACEGGTLIVDEADMECGRPPSIGDRLHTPHELLDKALAFHPSYSADGISNSG